MVYFIADPVRDVVKIGFSKDVRKRLKQLQTSNSNQLILLGYVQGSRIEEQYYHKLFSKDKSELVGEWFVLSDNIIDYLNQNNLMNCFVDRINGRVFRLNKMKNF